MGENGESEGGRAGETAMTRLERVLDAADEVRSLRKDVASLLLGNSEDVWETRRVYVERNRNRDPGAQVLDAGWEPFAVTHDPLHTSRFVYHLRRRVRP